MAGEDPRVQRTRQRVLEAASELLHAEGWDAVTQTHVAQYAGVGRATVYRHWPDARDLLVEALSEASLKDHAVPTGHLRQDLINELLAFKQAMTRGQTGRLMTALIDRAEWDSDFESIRTQLAESGSSVLRDILRAARRRGEIAPSGDDQLLIAQLVGPLVYRRFLTGQAITKRFVADVVDRAISTSKRVNFPPSTARNLEGIDRRRRRDQFGSQSQVADGLSG